ncbi:MAG: T9SS type A sorting domain-containing protein [Bacteroidota bacterium]|jgi:Secretion system C-terminal sorting domain
MKIRHFLFAALILCSLNSISQRLSSQPEITPAGKGIVIPYVDNIGYWKNMVRQGYVRPQKLFPWVAPKQGSSFINAAAIPPQDSPDIPVTGSSTVTQSENSVFIDPEDEDNVLNSNNSTGWSQGIATYYYGADSYSSSNDGLIWGGTYHGAGLPNNGDPATAISRDGRWYIGKISNNYGQNVAYSLDQGVTWNDIQVAPGPVNVNGLLDKNHMWVDNSLSSSFQGNVYVAWTDFIFNSPDTNQIQVSGSNDGGLNWTSPYAVSRGVNAGKMNHGVNIATGPAGQVYLAWSIYDTWPSDETAIGFTTSYDGGGIWQTSRRIISNIKGIRNSMTGKAMRVNSFPSMAVDLSTGPNRGMIYLVWANVGTPGINTGSDINIYLIKSADDGATWSGPVKVNQDSPGLGKEHYFPWITVDAVTGGICVIYYDDRNVSSAEAETWVSYSYDGGNSFTDFKVSDVSFTPTPIQGLAFNYFGDYIGIQSLNMKVYPVWTDNRLAGGQPMTWTSPFSLGPNPGQAWVMYYSNELREIVTGDTTGLKFGDSLHLSLGVKNMGDLAAPSLLVKISSPSAFIKITDSTQVYPDLAAGASEVVPNGFAFRVSDTIPDNTRVRFNVKVRNSDSSWYSHFSVYSRAPGLEILNLVIYDTNGGNRNHRFDPGETDDVVITVTNSGYYPCPAAYGKLSTDSPYLSLLTDSVYAGNIAPSQTMSLHYRVVVSPSAPTSAGVDLLLNAVSGKYTKQAVFHEIIGMIVEDWETGTFLKFPWSSGGNAVWGITNVNPFEGIYCVKSGTISDSQFTSLWLTYSSSLNDSISFYYKTSTELGYDFLKFYIDNVLQGQWSGETPWSRVAFPVSAGSHLYKWVYQKDLAESQGSDQVWLDFIVFPVPDLPVISGIRDDTICAGMNEALHATVQQYDSLRWTTYGDGTFSDPKIPNPVYTPGSQDIISRSAKLELSAFNQYGRSVKDMNLLIAGLPVGKIHVFPKDTVCHWQTIRLTADTTNAYTYLWTPGNMTSDTVIIDTALAGGLGSKLFRLKTINIAGCYKTDSVWLTFRNCLGIQDGPGDFSVNVFPNPTKGDFTVDIFSLSMETIVISIEDLLQNKVFEEKNVMVSGAMRKSYNFASLPSGIYILKIYRKDGTVSRKLIIDR